MFDTICRLNTDAPLKYMFYQQLSSEENSTYWVAYAREIAQKYNIDLIKALNIPWRKERWKAYIRTRDRTGVPTHSEPKW